MPSITKVQEAFTHDTLDTYFSGAAAYIKVRYVLGILHRSAILSYQLHNFGQQQLAKQSSYKFQQLSSITHVEAFVSALGRKLVVSLVG